MSQVSPSNLSHAAIRDYAEKVGEHHAIYSDSGHANLDLLMHELQMKIKYSDSTFGLDESSEVDDRGRMVINLPSMTSSRRDRFTIAHEIAHYFLHYLNAGLMGKKIAFGRGESNPAETQANVFASSLLMPEDAYRVAYQRHAGDPQLLAIQFGVSPAAARVRSSVLRLG